MTQFLARICLASSLACGLTSSLLSGERVDRTAQEDLARRATAVLREYCLKCHGPDADTSGAGLDVSNVSDLLENGYLDKDNPDESVLWQRIANGEMPPVGEPQPSIADGNILRQWIAAGAPQPERSQREFVSTADVLRAIRDDLEKTPKTSRPLRRYFTLTHLHNHPGVDDAELRLHAAALSKALNSLSWERRLVLPEAVGASGTVFAVNLDELGWDEAKWQAIVAAYPYGLHYRLVTNDQIRKLAEEIAALTADDRSGPLVHVRADWFAVTATRPPLYHTLLDIPETLDALEEKIGVDADANFLNDQLIRAGFAESGVSVANRAVEWHAAETGYYWKSFDFAEDRIDGNLFQQPLGPKFKDNTFDDFAFIHDGGEMIFSLPNGMQAYLLTDGDGHRIDEGPIAVVQDSARTAGTPVVVNGISCMHCHVKGTIPFRDTVRDGLGLFGEARLKVLKLYPPQERLDEQLAADSRRFMDALDQALRPYLLTGADEDRTLDEFPEPIGVVARRYHRNLSLTDAAAELDLQDSEHLSTAIRAGNELRTAGLGPLADGGTIDRAFWQSRKAVISPMQTAARVLDLGTPSIIGSP